MSERETGKVVKYSKDRGFGFVTPDSGGQDVFVHIADLTVPGDARKLRPGQPVTFCREEGDRGPKAVEVEVGKITQAEDDGMADLLSAEEFHAESNLIIDRAFRKARVEIREELAGLCRGHGWVD